MNKFIIMGRLSADPEIRVSPEGKTVTRFNFAVNRSYKRENEPEADFFRCVAFGKTAELFEKCNITKGTKLLIEGEVRNFEYEKDGVKQYGTNVFVNTIEFCESKASGGQASASAEAPMVNGGFIPLPQDEDDDLPF